MTVVAQAQDRLGQALACFVDAYQPRCSATSDADARVVVSLEDGRVARVGGAAKVPTLEVTAGLDILCDVLMLRRDPNEPYLFGELSVLGAEADFVRLDYIVSRLCPQ